MKRKVRIKVMKARPTAAPTTMPATVLLEREWPAVGLDSFVEDMFVVVVVGLVARGGMSLTL